MTQYNQLQLNNLACQRGDKQLFCGLSLCFQSGDFIQIEGHNGIGKTSLLRVMTGLSQPLTGEVCWNGVPIYQQRENFNHDLLYLGHFAGVKPELTAWENLRFYQQTTACRYTNEEKLWDVLQRVGLLGREDIAVSQLSAGQQKRVALARLWLSAAPLWILDEPFNAIDKNGVMVLTKLFEQHCAEGGITIITSHQDVPSETLQKVHLEKYKFQQDNQIT